MLRSKHFRIFLILLALISALSTLGQEILLVPIASGLNNPRGVAVLADGRLVVAEAGLGDDDAGNARGSGTLSIFDDLNQDGDFDDEGERSPLLTEIASYNTLRYYRSGHDEVFGIGDVLILDEDRIFFTKDDPFHIAGHEGTGTFTGDVGIFEVADTKTGTRRLVERAATLNSFVFDPERQLFYVTESGYNRVMWVNRDGEADVLVNLPMLEHMQQPVPAGIALDPTTGDLLVALFSGFVYDYFDTVIGFMPGDARIMRVDPDTGTLSEELSGLTTAVDVAIDEEGNRFVLEMTTVWPPTSMPYYFELNDPTMLPDPGGYARFTGRVTMYPAGQDEGIILADGLDTPTNITYAAGHLYVSTGLGTPGRNIITPTGIQPIEGMIYRISGF